jgi:hypothetical protein
MSAFPESGQSDGGESGDFERLLSARSGHSTTTNSDHGDVPTITVERNWLYPSHVSLLLKR